MSYSLCEMSVKSAFPGPVCEDLPDDWVYWWLVFTLFVFFNERFFTYENYRIKMLIYKV